MKLRRSFFVLLTPILLLSGLDGQLSSAAPATDVLARVHWLGLDRISADTNSARFMNVWRLPQTTALLAQTLDKFSRWPGGGATNAAAALLRPLLADLVSSESYWEVRAPANLQPLGAANPGLAGENVSTALARRSEAKMAQVFLAIHLSADRARSWQANLAAALTDLTGARPVPADDGWVLRQSRAPGQVEFSRAGEWTFVRWGPDTAGSLSSFAARIARDNMPPAATGVWLETDLDLAGLLGNLAGAGTSRRDVLAREMAGETEMPPDAARTAQRAVSANSDFSTFSNCHLTATGEGGNVVTRGTINFSRLLHATLSSWEIPTNLIHGPLTSFTAARGLAHWLAVMPAWQKLGLAPPPDQVYLWSQSGGPFQTYFAAPLPGASNQVRQLADRLVRNANPWLAANAQGNFSWAANPGRLVWNDAFLISPWLVPMSANQRDYVMGGLYAIMPGDLDPPSVAVQNVILNTTNLVYYQTELTGTRVEDSLFITQLFRIVFHKAQLPPAAAATLWLKHIEPLLDASTTAMTQTGPAQLDFTRQSTIGLNALELHLLADWLESPQFPHGLHTFLAPPDPKM